MMMVAVISSVTKEEAVERMVTTLSSSVSWREKLAWNALICCDVSVV